MAHDELQSIVEQVQARQANLAARRDMLGQYIDQLSQELQRATVDHTAICGAIAESDHTLALLQGQDTSKWALPELPATPMRMQQQSQTGGDDGV